MKVWRVEMTLNNIKLFLISHLLWLHHFRLYKRLLHLHLIPSFIPNSQFTFPLPNTISKLPSHYSDETSQLSFFMQVMYWFRNRYYICK